MIRSRRNVGKYKTNCYYGCCRSMTKSAEKRIIKRKEAQEWKRNTHEH